MNTWTAGNSAHNELDGRARLEQLADAFTQQGFDTTIIVPAPCLAVRIPGVSIPQMIYNTGGQFWWHSAQVIAPTRQVSLAAEVITWALRAHTRQPATHDATAPLATIPGRPPTPTYGGGRGQEC